jgi:cell division protein ZipA
VAGTRNDSRISQENAVGAPFLIQASVVARRGETFSGEELRDALLDLGLVHGEMDIFHRYDRNFREPLFSVASLVKPGTFPMDQMEAFDCPGVVFFFQPTTVPDPLAVFDDLFETSRDLAEKLDGIEWDEHRQPLTEANVRSLREHVEAACG